MTTKPGKLIVLYGINNLGKSTQAKLLVANLQKEGYKTEYLKFPIYDLMPSGEMINDYLRNGNFYNLSLKEAQIIYALNRTQYQKNLIDKLEQGINIVAEDYKGTGMAWGLGGGLSETFLKKINSNVINEDLVFLFDGERFKNGIEKGHRHENNNDLINKVRWAHLKLKEEYGWIKINANQTIAEIEKLLLKKTLNFLEGKKDDSAKKQFYNYSGFDAVGDIMSTNNSSMISQIPADKIYSEKAQLIKEEKERVENFKEEVDIETEDEKEIDINELKEENDVTIEPERNKEIDYKKEEQNEEKNKEGEIRENRDNVIKVERLNSEAKIPIKANKSDAGFDLFATSYYSITPYGQDLVGTGIKIELPDNYAALIWDKSGLASQGITTMGGVIDSGYRGEIKVVVKNLSEDMFNIVPGQKIAQLLIQEVPKFKLEEGVVNNKSQRGENNFGSSGKF
ncbi:MAG: dUTP diphosphatase [Patescibacteria group bacterium]|jgi:dUTP pyrophosphatase|nr:dUTP diphosphatase [Patescibacteria group bacterium]